MIDKKKTQVKELRLGKYLGDPKNEETYTKENENISENTNYKKVQTNSDSNFNFFLEQSKRKLNEFFNYNSVVDTTFKNGALEFLEWEFLLKVNEYGKPFKQKYEFILIKSKKKI